MEVASLSDNNVFFSGCNDQTMQFFPLPACERINEHSCMVLFHWPGCFGALWVSGGGGQLPKNISHLWWITQWIRWGGLNPHTPWLRSLGPLLYTVKPISAENGVNLQPISSVIGVCWVFERELNRLYVIFMVPFNSLLKYEYRDFMDFLAQMPGSALWPPERFFLKPTLLALTYCSGTNSHGGYV